MGAEGTVSDRGAIHADAESMARAVGTGDHVALIARGTVDAWHRRVERAAPGSPDRSYLVSLDDTVRGAAATATAATTPQSRQVTNSVVLATAEAPFAGAESFRAVLSEGLSDAADGGTVVVDDPSAFVPADADSGAVVEEMLAVADEFGVEFHAVATGDGAVVAALARRLSGADTDADAAVAAQSLDYLRETDPTNFGYLRRYWREARRGLTAVEMTYPQSKQVHAALSDPETTSRTLGAALQALVKLGALGVWGDTVAANRYDLTQFDPARIDAIGAALDALDD